MPRTPNASRHLDPKLFIAINIADERRGRSQGRSSALATRAVKGAASGLDYSLHRRPAAHAGMPGAVIHLQPLFIIVRRIQGAPEVKQPIPPAVSRITERNGAATFDGLSQH